MKLYTVIKSRIPFTGKLVTENLSIENLQTSTFGQGFTVDDWRMRLVNFDAYAKPGDMLIHDDLIIVCRP